MRLHWSRARGSASWVLHRGLQPGEVVVHSPWDLTIGIGTVDGVESVELPLLSDGLQHTVWLATSWVDPAIVFGRMAGEGDVTQSRDAMLMWSVQGDAYVVEAIASVPGFGLDATTALSFRGRLIVGGTFVRWLGAGRYPILLVSPPGVEPPS